MKICSIKGDILINKIAFIAYKVSYGFFSNLVYIFTLKECQHLLMQIYFCHYTTNMALKLQ